MLSARAPCGEGDGEEADWHQADAWQESDDWLDRGLNTEYEIKSTHDTWGLRGSSFLCKEEPVLFLSCRGILRTVSHPSTHS